MKKYELEPPPPTSVSQSEQMMARNLAYSLLAVIFDDLAFISIILDFHSKIMCLCVSIIASYLDRRTQLQLEKTDSKSQTLFILQRNVCFPVCDSNVKRERCKTGANVCQM